MTPERFFTGYDSYQLIFMYLEAVGKGFFSKLNIEPLISLQKMTQKSETNLRWLTVAMPLLETSERLERDKIESRER